MAGRNQIAAAAIPIRSIEAGSVKRAVTCISTLCQGGVPLWCIERRMLSLVRRPSRALLGRQLPSPSNMGNYGMAQESSAATEPHGADSANESRSRLRFLQSPKFMNVALTAALVVISVQSCSRSRNEFLRMNKSEFLKLLEKIEKTCASGESCPGRNCTPDDAGRTPGHSKLYLDVAVRLEAHLAAEMTCAEYLTLAWLGSAFWDFPRIEEYCQKARDRSDCPLDESMSCMVLGHVHFEHERYHARASRRQAREYFKEATVILENESNHPRNLYFLGKAYELWAQHELYIGNVTEAERMESSAREHWSLLRNGEDLICDMETRLTLIRDGKRGAPQLSCPPNLYLVPIEKIFPRNESLSKINCDDEAPAVAPLPEEVAPVPIADPSA